MDIILKRGDIVEFRDLGYAKGTKVIEEVIEFPGAKFALGLFNRANEYDDYYKPYSADQIVRRARSRLGLWDYNLFGNNCEHFANWCRYGIEFSSQTVGHGSTHDMLTGRLGGSVTLGPARVGAGLHGTYGVRKQDDSNGFRQAFVAEAKLAQLDFLRACFSLSATTGVNRSADGVGFQVLGTGLQIGREFKLSLFGSSFAFRLW
uniref:LRAT domain-containing protein n=1 Tax=Panagrolaimus sp. ES5 TaxID=591445 RepID=A0AC34FWF7_9BILA